MKLLSLLFLAALAISPSFAQDPAKPVPPRSATVPLTIDHNRLIIDVRVAQSDGTMKRVRCWVDNGNPDLWIGGKLAQALGLRNAGASKEANGLTVQPVQPPPSLLIGGMPISLKDVKEAKELVGREPIGPGLSAEINLPSTVLRQYEVAVDYLNRDFTIAEPGALPHKGTSAKALVNPENGLIQLSASIAGSPYNLALDMGASYSLISDDVVKKLQSANPKWPHMTGAVGAANMWGMSEEADWQLLRVPSIQYGPLTLNDVGVASFPAAFLSWFEKRAGLSTAGLLGGNAFLNYRVTIDYPQSTVYFEQTSKHRPPEMEVVGLTLRPEPDETYKIAGIADYDGKPSVPDAMPGDTLVAIDQTPAKGGTMGQVWSLLGGAPGDVRTLTLERDGKQFNVKATVRQFLSAPAK